MVLNPNGPKNSCVIATSVTGTAEAITKERPSTDNSKIRFPKLDECAHFHYDTSEFDNFQTSLIKNESFKSNRLLIPNIDDNIDDHSEQHSQLLVDVYNFNIFVRIQCNSRSWTVRRDLRDFQFLDSQLHKCVFDRQHSLLKPFDCLEWFSPSSLSSMDTLDSIMCRIDQYLQRLTMIISSSLTCGPILHWFEMDNHGNRLINEESDINTPAIGAAFVVKKHCKKDVETEISLEIGELISVIEMPPVSESFYWKGKRGFEVGYFPAECVQLIDEKITRKSEELTLRPLKKCVSPTQCHRAVDLNYSLSDSEDNHSDNPVETAIQKRSKISALLRNFVAGIRARRRDQLKRSGILKERVFGCDLCEHLENSGHEFPLVLTACCLYIEQHGLSTNGIYRISGVVSTINRLRTIFDEDRIPPELTNKEIDSSMEPLDIHAVGSLLKLYFRELPNPLLTYSLFDSFISTMRDESLNEEERVKSIKKLVRRLPPPHWRTLRLLMKHLSLVSQFHSATGMTSKNIAIVWAPNLLRTKTLDLGREALQIVATQAVLTEFLINNCDKIFDREEYEIQPSRSLYSSFVDSKEHNIKYFVVGPEIPPGKFHTILACRRSQSKRSRFNLPNFKFHNFFTNRPYIGNARHRLPLRAIQNGSTNNNNPEIMSRSKIKLDHFPRNSDKSHAVKYTKSFQSKILSCCSTDSESKKLQQVKRAESFDSYFKNRCNFHGKKKIENNNENILVNNANDGTSNVLKNETSMIGNYLKQRLNESTEIDHISNHHTIADEIIFEVEEKFVDTNLIANNDEENQFSQYVNQNAEDEKVLNSSIADNVEMMSDIEENNNGALKIESLPKTPATSIFDLLLTKNDIFGEKPPPPSSQSVDNFAFSNDKSGIIVSDDKCAEFSKQSDSEVVQGSDTQSLIKKTVAIDREKIDRIKEERRKKLQEKFLKVLENNKNNNNHINDRLNLPKPVRYRLSNSTQRLNPSQIELSVETRPGTNGERHDRAKLGRSMPTMELNFSAMNYGPDNNSTTIDYSNNGITSNSGTNANLPPTPTMTITPLRIVNKRQRIIYDKNDLNCFFKNDQNHI